MAKSENPAETTSTADEASRAMAPSLTQDDASTTVRKLVEIVVEHNLAELDLEMDGVRINIKGAVAAVLTPPVHVVHAPVSTHAAIAPPAKAGPVDDRSGLVALEAPMTGIFYRAGAPGDPPFVNAGDNIRVDQTICVIEAMKVFSDVPAEKAGKVVEFVAENGKLINMGDPILYIQPA